MTADLVGSDSDFMYIRVTSGTKFGVAYEIRVCKRSGAILCDCPHASYKMLRPNILGLVRGDSQRMCKHVQLIQEGVKGNDNFSDRPRPD